MPGPDGGAGLVWGVEPMCAVLIRARCADQRVDLLRVDQQDTHAPAAAGRRTGRRSSPPSAKTRRPASSCRPLGRASCGSGCAARAMTWPVARWSGSCANRVGRVPVTGPSTRPRSVTKPISRYPDLVDRNFSCSGAKSVVGGRLYLCVDLERVRLRRVRHRRLQPPDRGLAGRQSDDHRAGSRCCRARLLHPRPRRQHQPARPDCAQRCGQPNTPRWRSPSDSSTKASIPRSARRRCPGQGLGCIVHLL